MHRQFVEIFDQLVEGVFCVDANWHFTYLNPSARRLLLVGDEVLGRAIWGPFDFSAESDGSCLPAERGLARGLLQ